MSLQRIKGLTKDVEAAGSAVRVLRRGLASGGSSSSLFRPLSRMATGLSSRNLGGRGSARIVPHGGAASTPSQEDIDAAAAALAAQLAGEVQPFGAPNGNGAAVATQQQREQMMVIEELDGADPLAKPAQAAAPVAAGKLSSAETARRSAFSDMLSGATIASDGGAAMPEPQRTPL